MVDEAKLKNTTKSKHFNKKSLSVLFAEADETGEHTLKRTLGPTQLVMLGIGAIIGAGLFSITGGAAAHNAGPAVTISFVIAAVACAFAGLCYAEFASMIPVAGSAYTYSYATMGRFIAWIIGWDLVLEYAVGAATVSISWSRYLVKFLEHYNMYLNIFDFKWHIILGMPFFRYYEYFLLVFEIEVQD